MKKVMLLTTLLVMMICGISNAETYMLGWSDGGATNLQYITWGSRQNFHIGDVILFLYDPGYDSVLQVTRENFEARNTTNPLATWSDGIGQGFFEMLEPGRFYFISGFSGHCKDGEKFDILVPESEVNGHEPVQTPSVKTPSPSYDRQYIPNAHVVSSSSSSTSISSFYSIFQQLGALVLVSVLFSIPV